MEVTLNPDGVMAPLNKQLWECHHIILFGLRSIDLINEFPPVSEKEKEAFVLHVGDSPTNLDIQKDLYAKWLIKKGFEDLIKGIKLALIEAYFFVSIINKRAGLKTFEDLNAEMEELRKNAIEQSLPGLLGKVTPYLKAPLKYENHISSINAGRNCLVHSNGKVTDRHLNDRANKALILKGVKWYFYSEGKGERVEKKVGSVVEEGTHLLLGQKDFFLRFSEGEQIEVSFDEFNNFIKTCWLFGINLKDSLPELNN